MTLSLLSQHQGLWLIPFTSSLNLNWEDPYHAVPHTPWQRAVCLLWPQAADRGLCAGCSPPTVCPVVFYFSCCKNITFDLSLWLLKKKKKEETTNRLGFHSPLASPCPHLSSQLFPSFHSTPLTPSSLHLSTLDPGHLGNPWTLLSLCVTPCPHAGLPAGRTV